MESQITIDEMEITDKDNEFQVVVILYGADSNEQPTT